MTDRAPTAPPQAPAAGAARSSPARLPREATAAGLAEGVAAGDRRAIAETLTRLERQTADCGALLAALVPHLGRALVVGVTGPPGAGKSTLVNALIASVRRGGETVAVLAVDPSSPVSGGAILGDRIRMTAALDDDGVLVRSLASRGVLGGVTPAAVRMIDALDAAAFDLVVIETVGTGQSEIDVAEVADVVLVVSAPGLGDGIQAMKAGLIEIADVMVVNKADRPGAERTVEELKAALALSAQAADVPVVRTSAVSGAGIEALIAETRRLGGARLAAGLVARRRRRARYLIARAAADLVAERIRSGARGEIDELADRLLRGDVTPGEAAIAALAPAGASSSPAPPREAGPQNATSSGEGTSRQSSTGRDT